MDGAPDRSRKARGLSNKTLGFALQQIEERENEIREAWNRHFRR